MLTYRYVKQENGSYVKCEPNEADFLSVYRDNAKGLPEWIADFDPSEIELVNKLLEKNR